MKTQGNKMKQNKKHNVTTNFSYRIFETSSEGHLIEPKSVFTDSYLFQHYSGYPTLTDAENAIKKVIAEHPYTSREYVILPIITGSVL